MGFMSKLLSFGSDKDIKRYEKIVEKINGLEPNFVKMSDEELAGQTVKFRERYEAGETLDALLPEAFATVREACQAHAWHASFRCAAHRRHGVA